MANADPALVGGAVPTNLDARDAAIRDLKIISPLILAVVLVVLISLLRAWSHLVLILTVILSFFAAMALAASRSVRLRLSGPGLPGATVQLLVPGGVGG